MNRHIAALNERHATFRQVKGDRETVERLASVRYEETPVYNENETEDESDSETWIAERESDILAELFPYRSFDRASLAMEETD